MDRVRAQVYRRVEDGRRAARPAAAAGESREGNVALWCARRRAQRGRRSFGDTALTKYLASVGMEAHGHSKKTDTKAQLTCSVRSRIFFSRGTGEASYAK